MLVAVRRTLLSKPEFAVLDTFTRGDSALVMGDTEAWQAWTALVGTWGISTNRAYLAVDDGGNDLVSVDAEIADGVLDVTLAVKGTADSGVAFRIIDATNFLLFSQIGNLYKRDGGSYSLVASSAITPANGDVLRAVLIGNLISCYRNGASVVTYTLTGADATKFGTPTKWGLFSNGETAVRYDNFTLRGGLP